MTISSNEFDLDRNHIITKLQCIVHCTTLVHAMPNAHLFRIERNEFQLITAFNLFENKKQFLVNFLVTLLVQVLD